jgi:hypothetical protein
MILNIFPAECLFFFALQTKKKGKEMGIFLKTTDNYTTWVNSAGDFI